MLYFNVCPKCNGTVELKYRVLTCLMCGKEWYGPSNQSEGPEANLDFVFYKLLAKGKIE